MPRTLLVGLPQFLWLPQCSFMAAGFRFTLAHTVLCSAPCALRLFVALPKLPTTSSPAHQCLHCQFLWLPPPAGVLSAHLIKPTNNHAFIMLLSIDLPVCGCVCGGCVCVSVCLWHCCRASCEARKQRYKFNATCLLF